VAKTLLHRLFGTGKVPRDVVSRLNREGVLLIDEGIGGSVTFRNYRGPGRYHGWRRTWFTGSLVVSRRRLLAFAFSRPLIGVAWDDENISGLECSQDSPGRICFRFEAADFQPDCSGKVELRFATEKAYEFHQLVNRKARPAGRH
jgi:hypothetical protein